MTIGQVNSLDQQTFVEKIGWVFEDSPWVAARTWVERPFADRDELHRAMSHNMMIASEADQIALLRAHPDLGGRARMSTASVNEQTGAGLDQLTRSEFDNLDRMNSEYKKKFGFPYLYAVKGSTKYDILASLAERLSRSQADEFQEALTQVARIAAFRLEDLINGTIS